MMARLPISWQVFWFTGVYRPHYRLLLPWNIPLIRYTVVHDGVERWNTCVKDILVDLLHLLWGLVRLTLSVESSFPPQEHASEGSSRAKSDIRDPIPNKNPNETEHTVRHPERRECNRANAKDQIPLDKLEYAAYKGGHCGIKCVQGRHEYHSQRGAVGKDWPDIDHMEECGQ